MKKNDSTDVSTLEMFEKGTQEILNQNIPLSLELLKSCEISLEETVNKGLNADADLILATLHNIALCYQHLNNFGFQ